MSRHSLLCTNSFLWSYDYINQEFQKLQPKSGKNIQTPSYNDACMVPYFMVFSSFGWYYWLYDSKIDLFNIYLSETLFSSSSSLKRAVKWILDIGNLVV